jgi:multiple antibiotic resistance protein
MLIEFATSALVTLLVVVDPLGLVPAFLAVTNGLSSKLRREIALRACMIAAAILIGTALIGDWLLRQLGIGIQAFRIAGGLLLFAVAAEMVLGLRAERATKDAQQVAEENAHHLAAFPLAIPLMAGPGAITATILLAGQANYRLDTVTVLVAVIAAVMASCMLAFVAAQHVGKILGVTANVVLSRLLGVILAALAVQYIVDGVRTIFKIGV